MKSTWATSGSRSWRCDGVARRDFLKLGSLGALGLGLSDFLRLQALSNPGSVPKAKSCILIWLDGGPSHVDMFDLKPDAPSEVRSQFRAIPTTIPGLSICEHLPRTAKVMKHAALLRSLTHELGNHDTGTRFLLTGHRPTPALEYPSLGSLVAHQSGFAGAVPPYVAIPGDAVGGIPMRRARVIFRGLFRPLAWEEIPREWMV